MILDDILTAKRQEIEAAKRRLPFEELKTRVHRSSTPHRFREALAHSGKSLALIAELKRKSPSKGMLRERFDPVSLAQQLEEAGASALSVLTDERFFGGNLEILRDVKQFVEIPVLRKDFILEAYQIYEAAYFQADAVLLIVQVLTDNDLSQFLRLVETLGLDALVEVHTEQDLARALRSETTLIGINHRDLRTFEMDHETTARLIPKIPHGTLIVAESGIQTHEDVTRLQALGVHAVLIGESLMTAPDVTAKVRELFDGIW